MASSQHTERLDVGSACRGSGAECPRCNRGGSAADGSEAGRQHDGRLSKNRDQEDRIVIITPDKERIGTAIATSCCMSRAFDASVTAARVSPTSPVMIGISARQRNLIRGRQDALDALRRVGMLSVSTFDTEEHSIQ